MPYVKQERKEELDLVLDTMFLSGLSEEYGLKEVLFYYCKTYISPSYNNYKNFIGELTECACEIKRRSKDIVATRKGCDFIVSISGKSSFPTKSFQAIAKEMKKAKVVVDGDLNYLLFYYCRYHSADFEEFAETLLLIAKDIRKRLLAPYEDQKIKENGDV